MFATLNDNAYAVTVKSEIEEKENRTSNVSAVHTSLYRLEDKGFLGSEIGGATKTRGERAKDFLR